VTTCPDCPHRPENAGKVYYDDADLAMIGADVASRLNGEPHACHMTLDEDGREMPKSRPCVGQG
jgi:hypothetical protein